MSPQMLDAVSRVPGVEMAATVVRRTAADRQLEPDERRRFPGRGELKGDDDSIDRRTVSPEYLRTLRIPILRRTLPAKPPTTRGPSRSSSSTRPRRGRYWPGEDAIGKRVKINDKERGGRHRRRHPSSRTGDRRRGRNATSRSRRTRASASTLVMRTAGDPMAVLPAVKAAIWSVNKEQRLTGDTSRSKRTWIA